MKKDRKQLIVLILGLILVLLLIYYATTSTIVTISGKAINTKNSESFVKPIITRENFVQTLQQQAIIQGLPKKAEISLIFSDTKEEYTITKSSIKQEQASNPDMIISIPSSYIPEIYNLCNAITQANNNGDLRYQFIASKSALLWEYKAMLKYRSCLG